MTKSAFVAIVGRPNVGKSSLLNALVGEKVAIVSDKPQTTRTRILGILTQGEIQYVLLDTPGLHKPKTALSEYMVKQVNQSVSEVDVAVLVTEATGEITKAEQTLIQTFSAMQLPAILVINKIDLLDEKEQMLGKIAAFSQLYNFSAVVPLSVLQHEGIELLLEELSQFAQEGPHFFPDDAMTDQPERVIVAEIIREKILRMMNDEVPHGTAVVIEDFSEKKDLLSIRAEIYCERESHKGMIIGKHGAQLKKIGSYARQDLEAFFGVRVYLDLWVKVKEKWRDQAANIAHFGYRDES